MAFVSKENLTRFYTKLKELMAGMVKQEEGGTGEEIVTPTNADTLGGKLTANNVVFYEEEIVDEVGQVVLRNADLLDNHPASYFATSDELNITIANSGLKMDLLWTNASPTSNFGPQTISLDLSEYNYLMIEIRALVVSDFRFNSIITKNTQQVALGIGDSTTNNTVYANYRLVQFNDTSVIFGNVSWFSYNDNKISYNQPHDQNIPYRIYGIR